MCWEDCERELERLGLVLPTEAQWEYAARAGTTTAWWTGNQRGSTRGAANLAGSADCYGSHAPVGNYAANGFGLHDTIGNIEELCQDSYGSYTDEVRPGNGERKVLNAGPRTFRGGTWRHSAKYARSAGRGWQPLRLRNDRRGLRPARVIDP